MKVIYDKKYHFKYAFDNNTGFYVRSGILDKNGNDTGIDPFMGSFPHLIDVGVMGHCIHGKTGLCVKAGIGCYQSGLNVTQENMSVEHFEWIAKQCKGKCNQLALGGRGDPDQHEYFEELLKISRENDLIPNFTTSGFGITEELADICKKYCGAVAVSWYRNEYTYKAIDLLLKAKVKTNIHYVLSNNSIDEAIERLEKNDFPKGINAIIFLLHKPVGLGKEDNVLSCSDPRILKLFTLIDASHPFKVGMDSCTVPGAINYAHNILPESLDTCEGARFSCYISSDMIMVPCSFDQQHQYGVSLIDKENNLSTSIEDAWNSDEFEKYRDIMKNNCNDCKQRSLCMGGCPLKPQIVLCNKKERNNK